MAASELEPGARISSRYRIERVLGRGGMASVYEVLDEATGARLALKRLELLRPSSQAAPLFQKEFTALAQLAHPRIVQVYDYAIDGGVPYYVMELLSGESLRKLAPLDWRECCSLLRDVASALAIVHSRRLVHRDVTPRNIHRTADGRAKLMDFGSLSAMGVALDIVGTPPFLPPESFDTQPLDGRADLFSLGAVAYFLLTGQQAYPAVRMTDLPDLWTRPPAPPSAIVPEIPSSLDRLVMALLGINPSVRPQNAAEVIDRLTVLADLPAGETPEVAQAYLVTPTFVGRKRALRRFKRMVLRTERGRGATLILEGEPGVGRSRLLTNLLREAKLQGLIALRVSAEEGNSSPFGVARALAKAFSAADPALAKETLRESPRFAGLSPSEERSAGSIPPHDPERVPERIQDYTDLFLSAAGRARLVIGIDDLEHCDETSASVLAHLGAAGHAAPILVVATTLSHHKSPWVDRLRAEGLSFQVLPLTEPDTTALLSSVFGDVPYLESIASWVHRVSGGNPRVSLELAQRLVDQRVACFEGGHWRLPRSLDGLSLPESIDQALDERVAALGKDARLLAEALALTVECDPLFASEYSALLGADEPSRVFSALSELVAAGVLRESDTSYAFSHRQIKEAVRRTLPAAAAADRHRRLARAYAPNLLSAYHHFLGGEPAEALADVIVSRANRAGFSGRGAAFFRSPEAVHFHEQLFEWALRERVAPHKIARLSKRILQLAGLTEPRLTRYAGPIIERLRADSGLVFWERFASIADPLERIRACLGEALARHRTAPEAERGLEPARAVHELALAAISLTSVYATQGDTNAIEGLAALVAPLRPLAPGIDVLASVVTFTACAIRGQIGRDLKLHVLDQVKGPVLGIDDVSRTELDLLTRYYIALEEILSGFEPDLERLSPLEGHPSFAALIWQLKMLWAGLSGRQSRAELLRRKRDLAITGGVPVERHLDGSLHYELQVHVVLGDLQALRHLLPGLKEVAERFPHWRVHEFLARGTCHALRGELQKAIEEYQAGLDSLGGRLDHSCWAELVTSLARSLTELGRADEAARLALDAITRASEHRLLPAARLRLEMALALAEAHLGHAGALERARSVTAEAERSKIRGAVLIDLHASQARIAAALGDQLQFADAAHAVRRACAPLANEPFAARKLAELSLLESSAFAKIRPVNSAGDVDVVSTTWSDRVGSELDRCETVTGRARRGLELLLEHWPSEQAFLYLASTRGLSLMAALPNALPPLELEQRVRETFLTLQMADDRTTTFLVSSPEPTTADSKYELVPLSSDSEGRWSLVGIVALSRQRSPRAIPSRTLFALGRSLAELSGSAR